MLFPEVSLILMQEQPAQSLWSFWRLGFLTMAVLISLSTVFLKQHSVLDVLAGLAVCAAAYPLIYRVPAGAASLIPAGGLGRKRFPEL